MPNDGPPISVVLSLNGECRRLEFPAGIHLKQVLDAAGHHLNSACGGTGACDGCRVRVRSASLSVPTDTEQVRLGAAMLAAGWRLACQARVLKDLEMSLEHAFGKPQWRPIGLDDSNRHRAEPPVDGAARHAIAVDLGTTHLRVSVCERGSGRRVGGRSGFNPQRRFGSDILSRLAAAHDPAVAMTLSELVVHAIGDAISDLAAAQSGGALDADCIGLVGNTAMLALLSRSDAGRLLSPENWLHQLPCPVTEPEQWRAAWHLTGDANIQLFQPLAGFVGSDLLADLLACETKPGAEPFLVIDIGTNSELALWDGRKLWITATPGGPAFEGVGISCGIPSGEGAVYRILAEEDPGIWRWCVTGGGQGAGLCGSALVDLLALLLDKGIVHPSGRFAETVDPRGFRLEGLPGERFLKKQDVDTLQRGKAAIAAAAMCLLNGAGLAWRDLQNLYLCGAFGRYLHIPHGQAIGLLPTAPGLPVELIENAALKGCERALQDAEGLMQMERLRASANVLNLAMLPEFDDCFIDQLRLRPLIGGAARRC